ncbi:MAG: N(G),N(G)-dimethylarginine dimethylaminohydrolase [Gemmatimonadales bacterium]|jgi:dimethylargininase
MIIALTRPPTDALARCELTHVERVPIDIDRAVEQHRAYESALADCGARVVSLAPEPDLPDAAFVEDTAIVLDDVAVITRPGAASRRRETEGVARVLADYRPLERLEAPATMDGGDVVRIGDLLLIGASTRTNGDGVRQFGAIARRHGYQTRPVPIGGCLHLKSACTHVGNGRLLVSPGWVDEDAIADLELLHVPAEEPHGANTVLVGAGVLMARGAPRTQELLEGHGIEVRTVDLSELRKAEAGGSCMSVVFEGDDVR